VIRIASGPFLTSLESRFPDTNQLFKDGENPDTEGLRNLLKDT
jgi:hypothetical protein